MAIPLFATSLVNPDDLARRRKIAEALMSVQPNPQNMWTGIQSAIGQIGGSLQETSLNAAEKAAQAGYGQEYAGLGDNPTRSQLEAIGGNPWGNSGQQAVVNALLGQNIQSTDPTTQADLALKAEQLKQSEFDMNKPISVNRGWGQPDLLVDPHTYKTVLDPLTIAGADSTGLPPGTTGDSAIDPTVEGYSTKVIPGTGGLTMAAIDQGAMSNITAGTRPTGRTGPALAQATTILNRMAEMDPSGNLAFNKGKLASLNQSLATQQKYLDTTQRSVANAEAGFQQVVNTFQGKVNASQYPTINAAVNAAKAQLDPGTISAFQSGLAEVANEYTQVFSRGGQATDATRAKAQKIVNGDLSIADLQQVLTELQAQGNIVVQGSKNQVKTISDQINTISKSGSAAPADTSSDNGTPIPGYDNTFIIALPSP